MHLFELRQYTLVAGGRDVLIDLFEREFVESQEREGVTLIGQFRDLDDPRRFVWLRAFPSFEVQGHALAAFYGGPVWKAHRAAANAVMLDSDNVLLLRPAPGDLPFAGLDDRRAPDAPVRDAGMIVATIYDVDRVQLFAFADFFEAAMAPVVRAAGARIIARLTTERGANAVPALPVRADASVFAWFARFDDRIAYERYRTALLALPDWRARATPDIFRQFDRKPDVIRLAPTVRSRLR